jgi:hypothetical protein
MSVFARTAELRRSAEQYGTVAQTSLDVAHGVGAAAKELSGAISDPAVSTAVAASTVALLRELQLVGGAFAYSRSQLQDSADGYDAADEAAAGHLRGMVPRAE